MSQLDQQRTGDYVACHLGWLNLADQCHGDWKSGIRPETITLVHDRGFVEQLDYCAIGQLEMDLNPPRLRLIVHPPDGLRAHAQHPAIISLRGDPGQSARWAYCHAGISAGSCDYGHDRVSEDDGNAWPYQQPWLHRVMMRALAELPNCV